MTKLYDHRSMLRLELLGLWSAGLLVVSAACGPGSTPPDDPSDEQLDGEALYRQPIEEGNSYACATCHALEEPASDGLRRPGHPLGDATARPHYKNGQLDEMRKAVNSCLTEWMNAESWSSSDARWEALHSWLEEKAPAEAVEPIDYEIVEPPASLEGGDVEQGRELFNNSCAGCHGEDGAGTERAIRVDFRDYAPAYIVERVRKSGAEDSTVYDGLTGGGMPFWTKDRLSNDELRHIVAYLSENHGSSSGADTGDVGGVDAGDADGAAGDGGTSGGNADTGDTGGSIGECEATQEKVGWTAELEEKNHNVGGTAEIVDNCTVVIRNFTYDGRGIVVRAYGAAEHENYDSGYAMTDNLVRDEPYDGETLVATLPDDGETTLDDLGGISIWCVDVGVDFGSGEFTPE